jgi:16S rRNA U1498 N3-methylase RsmE
MSNQRFFIKDLESNPHKIEFPPDLTHQIKHVLRYHAGQKVVVLNGGGEAFQVAGELVFQLRYTIEQGRILAHV